MIGIKGLFELFAENLALNYVPFGPDFKFILEQFFQQFGGDVLVFEAAHFGKELVAQDGYIRSRKSGGSKDVDDLAFGCNGFRDELADGRVDLFGGAPARCSRGRRGWR